MPFPPPPPPPNTNDNGPHSELELLEGLLNNMFDGATSMLFKTLQEPFLVEVDPHQQQQPSFTSTIEDLDGSDFRRIAEKRRRNKQLPEGQSSDRNTENDPATMSNASSSPQNVISISNHENNLGNSLSGLWGALLGDLEQESSLRNTAQSNSDNHDNGWTFTSSSSSRQRTVQPDGTEEIVVTTRRNGRTETVTTIKHPDGTLQEFRNTSDRPSLFSMLSSTSTSNGTDNSTPSPLANNPISSLLRSIWG